MSRTLAMTILLVMPLCVLGEFEEVKLPRIFPGAQMKMEACYYDVDGDKHPDLVLIYSGGEIIKAFLPHEYYETMEYEREQEINEKNRRKQDDN